MWWQEGWRTLPCDERQKEKGGFHSEKKKSLQQIAHRVREDSYRRESTSSANIIRKKHPVYPAQGIGTFQKKKKPPQPHPPTPSRVWHRFLEHVYQVIQDWLRGAGASMPLPAAPKPKARFAVRYLGSVTSPPPPSSVSVMRKSIHRSDRELPSGSAETCIIEQKKLRCGRWAGQSSTGKGRDLAIHPALFFVF